ncbi:glycosyl transferase family 1 [Chloroflexus islandicus]|uniref:Glycosyl transferase family 1 n=1 Tax=Chloroflexus islandicus TaxID=1707952 RepID=A0A178LSU7_9CHLR|nr:glycosyltransferase family 1 protein [Chloroflexus islandicus]OAN37084.1 glycosyl transferase family 1 [Chloroflexus islandicus]
MRIAVNAHLLAHTRSFRRAGVSHYIEQVLLHLAQIDRANHYTVYTTRGLDQAALGLPANFVVKPSRLPTINPRVRIPWEQGIAPLILRGTADLYHGCLNVAPLLSPVPTVITIHDLAFIRFPQTFRAYNRIYLDLATRLSARRASRILAVSEHTKREVVGLLGIPSERVIVTPNAARSHFHPPAPAAIEQLRARHGLPERFVLYVGTLEPRKNLTTLLEAFALVSQSVPDVPLLIGGGKGWMYEPIFARLEQLNLRDRVKFAGYIPEEELPLWYAAATVFVFPSIYEGFGMPPLEAMACGTPVITSNTSSLPEVVGDAGLMVAPTDPIALAEAIRRVLVDADLRAELRQRGLARARRFSWADTAAKTLAAYREAVAV